ncbi:uncharacterized protein LOC116346787 [Contarinia nasturtii]|uniref:uncharacterized protein LOC116346787 n=1 Tax=Contarinia nasturtii TaxID=265458 RepID=UPI0012D45FC5|nr:uncharacterized protein LOC116346787 [Contarinia nasturtii]
MSGASGFTVVGILGVDGFIRDVSIPLAEGERTVRLVDWDGTVLLPCLKCYAGVDDSGLADDKRIAGGDIAPVETMVDTTPVVEAIEYGPGEGTSSGSVRRRASIVVTRIDSDDGDEDAVSSAALWSGANKRRRNHFGHLDVSLVDEPRTVRRGNRNMMHYSRIHNVPLEMSSPLYGLDSNTNPVSQWLERDIFRHLRMNMLDGYMLQDWLKAAGQASGRVCCG